MKETKLKVIKKILLNQRLPKLIWKIWKSWVLGNKKLSIKKFRSQKTKNLFLKTSLLICSMKERTTWWQKNLFNNQKKQKRKDKQILKDYFCHHLFPIAKEILRKAIILCTVQILCQLTMTKNPHLGLFQQKHLNTTVSQSIPQTNRKLSQLVQKSRARNSVCLQKETVI
jgi:hypothetical protein